MWQLIDSAFPSGGFAHSGGLEAACKHGLVTDDAATLAFVRASLVQAARQALPVVTAVAGDASRFAEADRRVQAMLLNHVALRASQTQGRSLLATAKSVWPGAWTTALTEAVDRGEAHGHLWPVWGAVCAGLGCDVQQARASLLFCTLRGLTSAAVRLGLIGPLRAQAIISELAAELDTLLDRTLSLTLDDAVATAPILDLVHANQDRLYSRLFQS